MCPKAIDPQAAEFFRKQRLGDSANALCCDYGTANSEWASVTYGIYISIGASGIHRSLGVKTSFVLSTTMDSWKPMHLRMMELGGNQRFRQFMQEQGVPEDMPIRKKYTTRAAEWYRENLQALAEGRGPMEPLPAGTGHLPASDVSSLQQALLDEIFAEAPREAMTAGGVPTWCATRRSLNKREAMLPDTTPPRPSSNLAGRLRRVLQGHSTARSLRSMSSGSMVGFGPVHGLWRAQLEPAAAAS